MQHVKPEVFLIAKTNTTHGLYGFIKALGAESWWDEWEEDHGMLVDPGERLIECASRMCYMAFGDDAPALNPNITRTRSDRMGYIENILKHKHGSVLEHVHVSFGFKDVSRVFTHELVRHRLANVSQTSLRFVRLTDLNAFFPEIFEHHPRSEEIKSLFNSTFETLEDVQLQLAQMLDLDSNIPFSMKKRMTSAMRRLAPIGLTTHIIFTTNLRQWRNILEQRATSEAEEEFRHVMGPVGHMLQDIYPAVFQDMFFDHENSTFELRHSKV